MARAIALGVWVSLGIGPAVSALEPSSQTCATRVSEGAFDVAELREIERLMPVALDADQAVFDLLEPLWAARSTERLRYLKGKRARDRSQLRVGRSVIARKRAEAKHAVLRAECFGTEEEEKDAAEARTRYEKLGCGLVAKDEEIAVVDLTYSREVLDAMTELRSREFATEQDLILAKYEVRKAETELKLRKQRRRECGRPAGTGQSEG